MNKRRFPIGTVLFLLFSVFTLLELWVLVLLSSAWSVGATILLVFATAIIGAALAKREGLAVIQKAKTQLESGQIPAKPLAEGVMILIGGALLLTPGLITDVIGFSTLIPPCRRVYGRLALRWAKKHFQMVSIGPNAPRPEPEPDPQIIEPWPKEEDDSSS